MVDEAGQDVPTGHIGELLARGPYTLRGYFRTPEHNATAFTEDGFFRTGDLVRRLPTGEIVVEGRVKDVVIKGGDKISATELEGCLATHPAVQQAAVVPLPDLLLGERVFAFVIAAGGPTTPSPTLAELRRWLRGRGLADFKLPDRVEVMDSFPLTGLGKVDKKALAATIAARRSAPPAAQTGRAEAV